MTEHVLLVTFILFIHLLGQYKLRIHYEVVMRKLEHLNNLEDILENINEANSRLRRLQNNVFLIEDKVDGVERHRYLGVNSMDK
mgnify:FL=1|jgi:hypothetical protein